MSRKAKKAMAVALTAGMLASTAATPVMAATAGWKQNAKGWWYENADGTYPANKWQSINGKWYYFDANGYMVSGWKSINGKWYYFGDANDGAMKSGWKSIGGKWYYLGEAGDGSMKDGWFKDYTGKYSYAKPGDGAIYQDAWQLFDGEWYYLDGKGYMQEGGWVDNAGNRYFVDENGIMQSGIVKIEDAIYYFGDSNDGSLKTGEQVIGEVTYKFDASGKAVGDVIPTATKAFKEDGTPVALTPEERDLSISGATAITKNTAGNFVFTVLLSETATAAELNDTKLTLTNGSIVVTASFDSVDGATAVYKIDDASKLTPGDTSANGKYAVTANGIDVDTDVYVSYEETLVGNAIQGIVYYYDVADKEYKGIEGATVTVDGKSVTTDANGYYNIPAATGVATVEITANGYFGEKITDTKVSKNYPTSQNVLLQTYVQEALYIEGTVLNAEDLTKKVSGAKVELQKKNSEGKFVTIADVTTGTDGKYVFVNDADKALEGITEGANAKYDFKDKKKDDKVLSEKDTYQIVVSKDYNYDANGDGVITTSADGDNLYDAYKKQEFAVKMNQTGANTIISDTNITPVKKITDASLLMEWVEDLATAPANLSVSLMDTNGTTLLAENTTIAVAMDGDNKTTATNLITHDDGTGSDVVSLFKENPTLPAGTYALVVSDSIVDDDTASPIFATKVITVKVTEGGKIEATGKFEKATSGTVKTNIDEFQKTSVVKEAYADLSLSTPLDSAKAINADGDDVNNTVISVSYNVYQKVDGITGGKVLVKKDDKENFIVEKDADGAISTTATNKFSKLEAGQSYEFVPTGEFINAPSGTFSNADVEKSFDKTIEAKSAGKINLIDLSGVTFKNNLGIDLTSQPTQIKLLSVTIKQGDKVVAVADDLINPSVEFNANDLSDIKPSAVFKDAGDLSHLAPGKYTAEIKINGYEAFTTEEFEIYDFQEATLSTSKSTKQIIETTISGSLMFTEENAEVASLDEAASIIVLDSNGIVVGAAKYSGGGTYSIVNETNAKIGAGTYTVVVRGAGFETYTKKIQLEANKDNKLDIVVTKHKNGGLVQFAIYDSNGFGFGLGETIEAKITLYDEYYVDPANTTLDKYDYLDKVFGADSLADTDNDHDNGSAADRSAVSTYFIGKFGVENDITDFAFTTEKAERVAGKDDILSAGTYKIEIKETDKAYGNSGKDTVTISKVDETASKNIVLQAKTSSVQIPVTVNFTSNGDVSTAGNDYADWVVIEDLNKNVIGTAFAEGNANGPDTAKVNVSKNGTYIVKVYVNGQFVGSQEVVVQDQAKSITVGLTEATRK